MHLLRILGGTALLLLALAAGAYPNFTGLSGVVGTPNALTAPRGSFTGAASLLFADDSTLLVRGLYGAMDRLEVGGVLVDGEDEALGIGAKYRLPLATTAGSLSVGLSLVDSDAGGTGTQAFIVGSRSLGGVSQGSTLLGSLGLTFTDLEDQTGLRPFVSAQLILPANTEVAGEFELEAGDFSESIFSLVARHRFTRALRAELGLSNAIGFVGTDDQDLFLGLAYDFTTGD